MKKHIFVIVRYSVFTRTGAKNFILGRNNNLVDYKAELFNDDRMAVHDFLFKHVTFESLKNQQGVDLNQDVTLIVLTSEDMPEKWYTSLYSSIKNYSWANIVRVNENSGVETEVRNIIASIDEDMCYATIRLDDDDGLSNDFLKNIYSYLRPEFSGHIVSHGYGYEGLFDLESFKFININEFYYPKVSAGLAKIDTRESSNGHVNRSIYGAGNHVRVDRNYPTILDSRAPKIFRSAYAYQDTGGKGYEKRNKNSKSVDIANISGFDFLEHNLNS
ncbi:glycosyltransferase [Carnimonas nigrificans]|uniref:glycosyltransferase n=1 Tax=Carnimonas nigrificans TaxID=64323 RepID=UPI0012EC5E9B|nr:glycosyltransferase [Carnimonas nigrificans]